jgi:hypothetical protein
MGPGTSGDPIDSQDVEKLVLEVLRLRDLIRGCEAQIGELETRLSRLDAQRAISEDLWQARTDSVERQRDDAMTRASAIEASTSWRVGQFVVRPLAMLRTSLRR